MIHGQILETWIPGTGANCLVVANDAAAANPIQNMVMTMAVPEEIELAILPVHQAARDLVNDRFREKKVILLVSNIADALKIFRLGFKFDRLNLGNLYYADNKQQVTYCVALDEEDLLDLEELKGYGVEIEARSVPQDIGRGFKEILSCCVGGASL